MRKAARRKDANKTVQRVSRPREKVAAVMPPKLIPRRVAGTERVLTTGFFHMMNNSAVLHGERNRRNPFHGIAHHDNNENCGRRPTEDEGGIARVRHQPNKTPYK